MPNIIYQCKFCYSEYGSMVAADDCEKSHQTIKNIQFDKEEMHPNIISITFEDGVTFDYIVHKPWNGID
jgi:MoaA/NifB/PqqE/SkfB family radical SAM enzyme